MTERNRLACYSLVTQAILKGIGISVHVSSDDNDARLQIDVRGVPREFRDRISKAINEVIDRATTLASD